MSGQVNDTVTRALDEDGLRAKLLASSGRPAATLLARELEDGSGGGGRRPTSAASRTAWLFSETAFTRTIKTALSGVEPVWLVTVLFADKSGHKIRDLDPKNLVQRVRMNLRRCLGSRVSFGVVEIEFDEHLGRYLPHVHILIPAADKREFHQLRELIKRSAATWVTRPLQAKEVHDLPGAISYLFKGWIRMKRRYEKDGRTRTRHMRLRGKRGVTTLLWQARYLPRDFMVVQGFRLPRSSISDDGLPLSKRRTNVLVDASKT